MSESMSLEAYRDAAAAAQDGTAEFWASMAGVDDASVDVDDAGADDHAPSSGAVRVTQEEPDSAPPPGEETSSGPRRSGRDRRPKTADSPPRVERAASEAADPEPPRAERVLLGVEIPVLGPPGASDTSATRSPTTTTSGALDSFLTGWRTGASTALHLFSQRSTVSEKTHSPYETLERDEHPEVGPPTRTLSSGVFKNP